MRADAFAQSSPFAASPFGGSPVADRVPGGSAPRASAQADFATALGVENRLARTTGETPAQEARRTAEELVSKVLGEPVFAQMRASNNAAPPFGPAPGEKQFAPLVDAQRALELVRSAHWPLVERLASDLTAPRSPDRQTTDRPDAGTHTPARELAGSRL